MRKNKKILPVILISIAVLAAAAFCVWFFVIRGSGKIKLEQRDPVEYEWKQMASECGITGDYLWSRTKELMVTNADDGVLIPTTYMIEGRLTIQPKEESGVYRLSDQALLMEVYLRRSDRLSALALKNEILQRYDMEEESDYDLSAWLMSYIDYYVKYGNGSDYDNIEGLCSILFDEEGMLRPETLYVAGYEEDDFYSVVDPGTEGGRSTLGSTVGDAEESIDAYEGVEIRAIDLNLISILEENGLLPEGSYERNLQAVTGAYVSDDIPLFAYAYRIEEGEISYVYSHEHAAAIDVLSSIEVMRNLAEVGQLPNRSYTWLKNSIMNSGTLCDNYYFVTGSTDGNEAVDSYTDILNIAYLTDDRDLYATICSMLGSRVATYTNSPALSMIFRSGDDRYYFVARENLEVCLALM